MIFWQIESILSKYDCNLKTPFKDIPEDAVDELMNGSLEEIRIDKDKVHTSTDYFVAFDGIVKYLRTLIESDDSAAGQKWASQFLADKECPACHGKRLKKKPLPIVSGTRTSARSAISTSTCCATGSTRSRIISKKARSALPTRSSKSYGPACLPPRRGA